MDDEAIKSTETRIDDEAIKSTETRMHYMYKWLNSTNGFPTSIAISIIYCSDNYKT